MFFNIVCFFLKDATITHLVTNAIKTKCVNVFIIIFVLCDKLNRKRNIPIVESFETKLLIYYTPFPAAELQIYYWIESLTRKGSAICFIN